MSSFCFSHAVIVGIIIDDDDDNNNGNDNNHDQDVLLLTSNTKAKRETGEKEVIVEEEESVQSGEYTLKEKINKTNQINCCATNNSVTHLLEHVQHLNQ